jgi:uncharacterized protein
MNNTILVFGLTLLLSISTYASNFPDYIGVVNDYENVFSEKQEKCLSKILHKNEAVNKVKIIVVSTNSFQPAQNYKKYIFVLFEHWKMTAKSTKKGILVLVSLNKKELKIIPGSEMEVIFDERKIRGIVENIMTPKFVKEKYFTGLKKGIKSMVKTIKNYNKVFNP